VSARHGFRPDIEGLRTIAIVSVVLYHAGVPSLSGGFVGVDLFFVLSGFLITGMLVRELELSGRISLRDFWARRVRRLLPAATTVLILIGLCSFVLMPATVRTDTAMAIVASTVYVANWFFAANSLDYLNAEEAPSPVLHFWSLGVEEQFYVLWPVLLLAIVVAVKRLHLRPRPALAAFAGIVWIGSFAASLYYSEASQPIAFFSSPTRFWQLATGALLALATPAIRRQRRDVLMGAQIIGMVVLLYAIVETGALIERGYTYPGALALIPTLGTALLVAGGTRLDSRRTPIELVLNTRLFQWVGGMSYSWYLWHWPVLVLWQRQFGDTSVQANVLLAQAALALAWTTHTLIENPIRFSRALRDRPEASLAIGAIFMAFSIVVASVLSMTDASHAEAATTRTFRPLPTAARSDVSKVYAANCVVAYHDVAQPTCIFGDKQAKRRMVLIGDSHAASVFPAFETAAKALQFRLDVRIKLGCTIAEVDQWHFKFNHPFTECSEWRAQQVQELVQNPADVVVVVNANNPTPPVFDDVAGKLMDVQTGRVAWIRGYASTLQKIRDAGSRVIMLRDNPRVPGNIADCVAMHMDDPAECNYARRYGLPEPAADVLAARAVPGIRKMDLSDAICDRNTCYAVRNNILAWQKGNHYTATFADSLSKKTTDKLRRLLDMTQSTNAS
jgi:peptidoglycan/LPS O-acetylase OafA/YrhL